MGDQTKPQNHAIPELLTIAMESGASVRLENCLREAYGSGRLKIRTVRDYLEHAKDGPPPVFFAIPNLGAKSRRELHAIVLRAASGEAVDTSGRGSLPATDIAETKCVSEGAVPTELSAILSSCLDTRELSVIAQRFGLAGHRSATLEEVGVIFNVTRERIRQIEKKALSKLGRQKKHELRAYLERHSARIVAHLWKGVPWVSSTDLAERTRTLDGETALALIAAYRSEWMSEFAVLMRRGWLLKPLDIGGFKKVTQEVSNHLKGAPLPTSVAALAATLGISQSSATAAIAASGHYRVFRGYVCPPVVGSRTRRTVTLVETLLKAGRGRALPIAQLAEACRDPNSGVAPTTRDLNIVLASHRHLFVNLYEEGWATCAPVVGSDQTAEVTVPEMRVEKEELDRDERITSKSDRHDHTLRRHLANLLGANGPMQMADLRDAIAQMNAGAFSRSSVGPVLLLYEDFIRIAPGIYALREAWRSGRIAADQIERVLLTESHCAIYVRSRWAGEPQNLYPAWTPAMELAWARWARRVQKTQLLKSLLAVANPDRWPLGQTERRAWAEIVSTGKHYGLQEKLRTPIDETIPSFLDLLSASLWARQQGHLSWISANRTAGRRIDDRHAVSTMALLIVFGIILPAEHWQAKHIYRLSADSTINGMLDFAFRTEPGWPVSLAAAASSVPATAANTGWLGTHDLTPLLAHISAGSAQPEHSEARSDPKNRGILSELRAQSRRSRLAGILDD